MLFRSVSNQYRSYAEVSGGTPLSNFVTELEMQELMEPLFITSINTLTAFEFYDQLVLEFGHDPTLEETIMSALIVATDIANSQVNGLTSQEVFNCIGIATGIAGFSGGLVVWGFGELTTKSIVLRATKILGRTLGIFGLAYAIWGLTDCLISESAD